MARGDETAIAKRERKGRAFESRHRQFVEDRVIRLRRQWLDYLEARAVAQKPWLHSSRFGNPLPCHGHAELEAAHPCSR
jgi:hypothetical protein